MKEVETFHIKSNVLGRVVDMVPNIVELTIKHNCRAEATDEETPLPYLYHRKHKQDEVCIRYKEKKDGTFDLQTILAYFEKIGVEDTIIQWMKVRCYNERISDLINEKHETNIYKPDTAWYVGVSSIPLHAKGDPFKGYGIVQQIEDQHEYEKKFLHFTNVGVLEGATIESERHYRYKEREKLPLGVSVYRNNGSTELLGGFTGLPALAMGSAFDLSAFNWKGKHAFKKPGALATKCWIKDDACRYTCNDEK